MIATSIPFEWCVTMHHLLQDTMSAVSMLSLDHEEDMGKVLREQKAVATELCRLQVVLRNVLRCSIVDHVINL